MFGSNILVKVLTDLANDVVHYPLTDDLTPEQSSWVNLQSVMEQIKDQVPGSVHYITPTDLIPGGATLPLSKYNDVHRSKLAVFVKNRTVIPVFTIAQMQNVRSTQDLMINCEGKESVKVAIGFD